MIIPGTKYRNAEVLLDRGNIVIAYGGADGYQDARERSIALRDCMRMAPWSR